MTSGNRFSWVEGLVTKNVLVLSSEGYKMNHGWNQQQIEMILSGQKKNEHLLTR